MITQLQLSPDQVNIAFCRTGGSRSSWVRQGRTDAGMTSGHARDHSLAAHSARQSALRPALFGKPVLPVHRPAAVRRVSGRVRDRDVPPDPQRRHRDAHRFCVARCGQCPPLCRCTTDRGWCVTSARRPLRRQGALRVRGRAGPVPAVGTDDGQGPPRDDQRTRSRGLSLRPPTDDRVDPELDQQRGRPCHVRVRQPQPLGAQRGERRAVLHHLRWCSTGRLHLLPSRRSPAASCC